MDLRTLEVYSPEAIGRDSYLAYLKENGQKVILKPADSILDMQLIGLLEQLDINGLPRVLGRSDQPLPGQIVFSWQEGEDIFSAKLTSDQVEFVLTKLLILIDKLDYFSGQNCYFLDLKASHILVKDRLDVGLIDFEHVLLSPERSLAWSDLEQVVGSQALTSKEITSDRLTLAHQDYSLAMIALSVVAQKPARELRKKHKIQALKSFSPAWQEQLKRALNLEGFEATDLGIKLLRGRSQLRSSGELDLASAENCLNKENQDDGGNRIDIAEYPEGRLKKRLAEVESSYKAYRQVDCTSLENSERACRKVKVKIESSFEWPNLLVQELTFVSGEKPGERKKLLVLSGLVLVGLCPCHGLPVRHELALALLPDAFDRTDLFGQILADVQTFSERTMDPYQLTKQLANHIVEQTKIRDLFLSNRSQAACSWQTGYGSAKTTIHQFSYGRFSQDEDLVRKLMPLLDRAG